jgi:hypothetical protein
MRKSDSMNSEGEHQTNLIMFRITVYFVIQSHKNQKKLRTGTHPHPSPNWKLLNKGPAGRKRVADWVKAIRDVSM